MYTLNCKGRLLIINNPVVMGILNATPDSFYEGSRVTTDKVLSAAEMMLSEGATILDIGGQSTRPGAERVTVDEELKRVIPAITAIKSAFPECFISIDTFQGKVAREAVAAGADIINDISAGNLDDHFIDTVAALQVPYILMHMQGTPDTMQQAPQYDNVTLEVLDFFIKKTEQLRGIGINDIIIDPGFGFGKTSTHNFTLLKNLAVFRQLSLPVLLGISRKATIYKTLGTDAAHALNGTTVLNTIGLLNGAGILRVHDVKEAAECIQLVEKMNHF